MLVGVISDTHNLLRDEATFALAGVSCILHAGDVCVPEILERLERIAPVYAVRGNNDTGEWSLSLPEHRSIEIGGARIHMCHIASEIGAPNLDMADIVITGHSHKPVVSRLDGRLWLNPGSAGRRRFKLPVTLALLHLQPGDIRAELVSLL